MRGPWTPVRGDAAEVRGAIAQKPDPKRRREIRDDRRARIEQLANAACTTPGFSPAGR